MAQELRQFERRDSISQASETSQTAADYISSQLQLEADAREALPYQFDTCTFPLGALRQTVFSCLTCNPPPSEPSKLRRPAGVCYACSISCHGEHELVELFTRRNFTCDCGTTRLPETSKCSLRVNSETGIKGEVHSETPSTTNSYNHNFINRFCGCGELYDPNTEKGTMFQCLGLGTTDQGGCGEDWWHPECIVGLSRDWYKVAKSEQEDVKIELETPNPELATTEMLVVDSASVRASAPLTTIAEEGDQSNVVEIHPKSNEHPVPPGFPNEDDFEHLMCYKCVEAFPWIKRYANSPHILSIPSHGKSSMEAVEVKVDSAIGPVPRPSSGTEDESVIAPSLKRKADEDDDSSAPSLKKTKSDDTISTQSQRPTACKYTPLPPTPSRRISLFLLSDFREHICHCPNCFPLLTPHPQLLDEETVYEPPVSDSGSSHDDGTGSIGSRSLLDRGEAALSNMDRVRAIEGVMAYNKLRDNLKGFLKPFAESGQAVGAEDIKRHFEKLRGDDEAIRQAARDNAERGGGDGPGDERS